MVAPFLMLVFALAALLLGPAEHTTPTAMLAHSPTDRASTRCDVQGLQHPDDLHSQTAEGSGNAW